LRKYNPRTLRKPKVHHPLHISPLLVPILNQIKQFHTLIFSTKAIYVIVIPSTHWSSKYRFASCFPTKNLYAFLSCPIRATSPVRLIPLHYIQMIFAEESVSWRSSLCHLLQAPVTGFLLDPNAFSKTLFCNNGNPLYFP